MKTRLPVDVVRTEVSKSRVEAEDRLSKEKHI